MAEINVSVSRSVAASPELTYQYIADYDRHHGNWLPPEYSQYRVSHDGDTTVVDYHLKTGRRERDYHMRIEKADNSVREVDAGSSLIKTWTVEPEGAGSRVRIDTRWRGAGGVGGFFERTFAPRVLHALYANELARLGTYAGKQKP